MGYDKVKITACTEWIGRMTEGSRALGLKRQSEWKVRDALLALGYGYDTINLGSMNDASDAYYYSIWANGGLCQRFPIMAPKPAYAAVATLALVLDKAEFTQFVDTGSTVCYLQEFKQGDGWVYVTWVPAGKRGLILGFADNAKRKVIDLYGRDRETTGSKVTTVATTSPQYIRSASRLLSGLSAQNSHGIADAMTTKPVDVLKFDNVDNFSVTHDEKLVGKSYMRYSGSHFLKAGKVSIKNVIDEEMGECVEIELDTSEALSWHEVEFFDLQFKEPISTRGKSARVIVKGNGSWGSIDLLKSGWGPWADNKNLNLNWSGDATMNFDGWGAVDFPYYDWVRGANPNRTKKVTGIRIAMPRTTLVGTERKNITNQKIRVKQLEFYGFEDAASQKNNFK